MLKSLYMVRHGESEWNACHRIQGQLDSRLSARGRSQAQALSSWIGNEQFDAVYSSDLSRAAETAAIATGRSLGDIRHTPALREVSFGAWEGLTIDEVKLRYREELDSFRRDPVKGRPKTGESFEDFSARVGGLLKDWHEAHDGETVLAVTHGGPIRMALILLLGLPPVNWRALRVANTGLTRLDFTADGACLGFFNTTGHLCAARRASGGGEDEAG